MANVRNDFVFVHSTAFRRLAIVTLFVMAVLCGSLLWGQSFPPQTLPRLPQAAPQFSQLPQRAPQLPPELPPELHHAPPRLPGQENVVKVEIRGNQTVAKERILPSIRTRANRPFDIELVEEDIRRLNRTGLFVDVKPYTQAVPGGLAVIFEVFERPLIRDIMFVGNVKIKSKALAKEIDFKVGDAVDPYPINQGRKKIEEFYQSRGFSKVRVDVFEGNKPQDQRVVYLINEGHKQKILITRFIGNTIASDSRLRTQIESKPPTLYLFKGEVNHKEINEDVDRLTSYYRGLGFLKARVGREMKFIFDDNWLVLTFVINEGPRFVVDKISFEGNMKTPDEKLTVNARLKPGDFFNQTAMLRDQANIQDKYGSIGYVFADVKVDLRMHEGVGKVDLVYDIREGDRYRIGDITVDINGDYPHTRITTVLNRLSLKTGDIFDIRELRASERRLRASGLFLVDPQKGISPKIVFSPPQLDEMDAKTEVARRPRSKVRGQSPNDAALSGNRRIRYTIQAQTLPLSQWPPETQTGAPVAPQGFHGQPQRQNFQPRVPQHPSFQPQQQPQYRQDFQQRRPQYSSFQPQQQPQYRQDFQQRQPQYSSFKPPQQRTVRGQSIDGRAVPSLGPPNRGYAAPPRYSNPYPSQQYPGQQSVAAPSYGRQPSYGSQPQAGGWATQQYANPPAPGSRPLPNLTYPRVAVAPAGAPVMPDRGVMNPNSPSFDDPLMEEELIRPLDIGVKVGEAPTGRFMFGLGINSDAGLVGSVVIDERNFDLFRPPRSWRDFGDATAFRGAGQSFRIEAVPGTRVQRYMVNFQEPYLLNSYVALGLSGFYYDRYYLEYTEGRVGGRASLGYQFRPDLSGSVAFRGSKVNISNPVDPTLPELMDVLGDNSLYGFRGQLAHDTRDNAFLATSGHLIEVSGEQVLGTHTYTRGEIDIRKYFLLHERADGSGRHVLGVSARMGITSNNTPIYDHYFIGGFSTLRGFDFREASPRAPNGVLIGGEFMMLVKAQYMFPITADDMLHAVVFCDTGTVEPSIDNWTDKYRVAPGVGLRITVPAMGPAPIALDFAFPFLVNPGDREEMFSFFVGFNQ